MHSSLIGKIDKARRYALEPQRMVINGLQATFHGDHDQYDIGLEDGHWTCGCHSFEMLGLCAHIMAVQRLFDVMLTDEARAAIGHEAIAQSTIIGKIEKARRYAQQPERVRIRTLDMSFQGEHDTYVLAVDDADWRCSCHTYLSVGLCAHIMAVQRVLEPMLSIEARTFEGLTAAV